MEEKRYRLLITRTEPDPDYASKLEAYEKMNHGYRMNRYPESDMIYPSKTITTEALVCELTEEQFKKVKENCFKVFE